MASALRFRVLFAILTATALFVVIAVLSTNYPRIGQAFSFDSRAASIAAKSIDKQVHQASLTDQATTARQAASSLNKQTNKLIELENEYFNLTEQVQTDCPQSVRVGNKLDGGWDVCMTGPFNISRRSASSRRCLAFSFGINHVWNYDDQLAGQFACRVYMFDPSMQLPDHRRKPTAWFFQTGLSGSDGVLTGAAWKMRTLCGLFEELGYGDSVMDLVKLDIEHWEWDSLDRAITDGCLTRVKQLLFESHTSEVTGRESDYAKFINVWRRLFQLGYRVWKWHRNPQSVFFVGRGGAVRACCYEHYLINTKFLR